MGMIQRQDGTWISKDEWAAAVGCFLAVIGVITPFALLCGVTAVIFAIIAMSKDEHNGWLVLFAFFAGLADIALSLYTWYNVNTTLYNLQNNLHGLGL